MENTITDNHTGSSNHNRLKSAAINPDPLSNGEHTHRRRPITLMANLETAQLSSPSSKNAPVKKTSRTKNASESNNPQRLKSLKTRLADSPPENQDAKKTPPKVVHESKDSSEKDRSRHTITLLKTELIDDTSSVLHSHKTPVQTGHQEKKSGGLEVKNNLSTDANAHAETATIDSPAAAASVEHPAANVWATWFSWITTHRRLLLIVAISFVSGILVSSWFGPGEPPAPRQGVADSAQSVPLPVSENVPYQQPAQSTAYYNGAHSRSASESHGYPVYRQSYGDPHYGRSKPQQRTSTQYSDRAWDNHNAGQVPQTTSASPWRQPDSQTTDQYNKAQRPRYAPWSGHSQYREH